MLYEITEKLNYELISKRTTDNIDKEIQKVFDEGYSIYIYEKNGITTTIKKVKEPIGYIIHGITKSTDDEDYPFCFSTLYKTHDEARTEVVQNLMPEDYDTLREAGFSKSEINVNKVILITSGLGDYSVQYFIQEIFSKE